jgi:hypothetical protein
VSWVLEAADRSGVAALRLLLRDGVDQLDNRDGGAAAPSSSLLQSPNRLNSPGAISTRQTTGLLPATAVLFPEPDALNADRVESSSVRPALSPARHASETVFHVS